MTVAQENGGFDPQEADLLDILFRTARTFNEWQARPVDRGLLLEAQKLAVMGPTSANCQPLRIVFIESQEARTRLLDAVAPGNIEKVRNAPVTAIFAQDMQFYDHLPKVFPHRDVRSGFLGRDDHIRQTAFRNATLQAAYYMLALRAVGLDCGPLSGFSNEKVNEAFFPDGRFESNFLCNIGYGNPTSLFERLPRLKFEDMCSFT